ncbi:TylF/MycF/NovP-related O-methyltransferase [Bradyrhizobium sp. BR 10261]|uniref:TylF/MycF/NovP-related O-methyltransferase n=1 Tax=Bradyrhizobium sp. BR 10261 TaxID=2749992 RepID=UPI001C654693|nr:TylF/MycF/NovP-related O-methyltransferase [Bradyrhizobium sp. BR 10261]MBW7961799.1 class I SAM-dependent methyltransferase [Bradyrhizobium sp. BR 10261]
MGVFEDIDLALKTGNLDEAVAHQVRIPVHNTRLPETNKRVVDALFHAGRLEDAERLARAEVERRPKDPDAYALLARALQSQEKHSEAANALGKVYHWIPTDPIAAASYATALRQVARDDDAELVESEHACLVEQSIERLPRWISNRPPQAKRLTPEAAARQLYLDLLERAIANTIYQDSYNVLGTLKPYESARREMGKDIPSEAHSMIGLTRLRQTREAACQIIEEGIPGDFIETGVWRGGACILLRGVLAAYGDTSRRVWVADSFEGLPPPDPRFTKDAATRFDFHARPELSVGLEAVKENFSRYGLLDDQVAFLKGYFRDTLPRLPEAIRFSLIRLDGDLYSSTTDALTHLYHRVSPGGFVIIDDYGPVIDARRATLDFRATHSIVEQMYAIDSDGVFWRKAPFKRWHWNRWAIPRLARA